MSGVSDSVELTRAVLIDSFDRVAQDLPGLLSELSEEELLWRPDPEANSIAWLAWHLARVQDDHMAGVGGVEQVWTSQGWEQRFGLPYDTADIGWQQTSEQVGQFASADPQLLIDYQRAAHELTIEVLKGLDMTDYSRIVDRRWDPPVTAAVRVVSVINDITAHLGQVGYIRGLAERRR